MILGAGWETRVGVGPSAMSLPLGDAPPASAGPHLPAPQSVPTLLRDSSAADPLDTRPYLPPRGMEGDTLAGVIWPGWSVRLSVAW